MRAWIISVSAACLILSVSELILSDGKTKKYLSGILRMVVITLAFLPIVRFFADFNNNSIDSSDYLAEETMITINNKNDFFIRLTEIELNKKGIPCSIKITDTEDKTEYLDIIVYETVINEEEGNIYKNSKTIIETVEKYTQIDRERIRVWINQTKS